MSIAIIASPNMQDEYYQWIDDLRRKYPELGYDLIKPHFTLVYPITDSTDPNKVITHVNNIAVQTQAFQFVIASAVPAPGSDWKSKANYVFLVPDEGFSNFIRLHGVLSTNIFEADPIDEIPFLPHLTIGYCDNAQLTRQICLEINQQGIKFIGRITQLLMIEQKNGQIISKHHFPLLK